MKNVIVILALITSLVNVSCDNHDSTYHYAAPVPADDGLKTGTLTQADMNVARMTKAIEKIKSGRFNEVHAMLIYKDDMLVLEEYFKGHKYQWDAPKYQGELVQWDKEMLHQSMSCSKSFTSACVGIAIEKGYIRDIHESIFNYLPDYQRYKTGGKEGITIEHLLTMTSGLAWDEWGAAHGTSANDIDRLYFDCSDDPIKCVLERDLVHQPGETFNYSGGGVIVLGEIIKNASHMDMGAFSKKFLFDPLGIDSVTWFQYNNGTFATDGSLNITPRDMLKFGVTYLHQGRWNDTQIIPEAWVTKSSTIYNHNKNIVIPIEDSGKNGYGYLWWISQLQQKGKSITMYRANGWGGQTIMVFPEVNMVVVFTSGNYASKSRLFRIIKQYILPATT